MESFLLKVIMTLMALCITWCATADNVNAADLDEETIRTIVEHMLNTNNGEGSITDNEIDLSQRAEYLEDKIRRVETTLMNQDKTIAGLQNEINELQNTEQIEAEIDTDASSEYNKSLTHEKQFSSLDWLITRERRLKRAIGLNVAFSAYLSHNILHVGVGSPIKFDQVLHNDGNHYDTSTGIFTVPLTGVYLFTFNFDAKKLTFLRLTVDGANQVDAVVNAHTNAADDRHSQSMGGNTAILHLRHGQLVSIQGYEIPDGETASSNTFRLCTFSGVLLY